MSSMPTSRKRNNNSRRTKILVSILGFLCLSVALSSCSRTPKNNADSSPNAESAPLVSALDDQQLAHVKECNGRRVSSEQPVDLMIMQDGKLQPFAILQPGQLVQLKEISDPDLITSSYLPLDRMDQEGGAQVLIDALQVTPSGSWLNPTNHLLERDFAVKLKAGTRMKNDNDETILTTSTEQTWLVYAEKEEAYGVELQGRIVWVDKSQAEETLERSGTAETAATSLPVLMYHFFYSEADGQSRDNVNYVEVEEFREQLQALQDRGYVALTMREVEMMMKGWADVPEKAIAITIDDGDPTVYQYAYPVLKEFGYNATLFLITGWMNPQLPYEFFQMREDGLELQSHSFLMHQGGCKAGHGGRLLCVDSEEGVNDTRQSLEYVDGGFVYCYPFGDVNDHAVEILKEAGVQLAFTTEYGKIKPGMDLYRLPRIRVTGGAGLDRFIKSVE